MSRPPSAEKATTAQLPLLFCQPEHLTYSIAEWIALQALLLCIPCFIQ